MQQNTNKIIQQSIGKTIIGDLTTEQDLSEEVLQIVTGAMCVRCAEDVTHIDNLRAQASELRAQAHNLHREIDDRGSRRAAIIQAQVDDINNQASRLSARAGELVRRVRARSHKGYENVS